MLDPFVPAYKVGSGDVTWTEILAHIARKKKPARNFSGSSCLEITTKVTPRVLSILRRLKKPRS